MWPQKPPLPPQHQRMSFPKHHQNVSGLSATGVCSDQKLWHGAANHLPSTKQLFNPCTQCLSVCNDREEAIALVYKYSKWQMFMLIWTPKQGIHAKS